MRFGRKPWWWLLLALGVVIAGFTWLVLTSLSTPVVRLPDGREFRLESVTFGKNHRYVCGKPWIKVVAPLLSSNLITRLGGFVCTSCDTNETLVCWVVSRQPIPRNRTMVAAIADRSGLETIRTIPFSRVNLSPTQSVQAFKSTSFPRRAHEFDLVLTELVSTTRVEVARFALKNPARRSDPSWPAEPLPITRIVDGETFTLTEFNTGLDADVSAERSPVIWSGFFFDGAGPLDRYSATWSELRVRFGSAAHPSGPWDIAGVELSDATGNVIAESDSRQRFRLVMNRRSDFFSKSGGFKIHEEWNKSWGLVSLPFAFWPEETWRIRLELRQKSSAPLRSDQLVHVQGLPVPGSASAGPTTRRVTTTNGTFLVPLYAGVYWGKKYPGWITVNVQGEPPGRKGEWTLVQVEGGQWRTQSFAGIGLLKGEVGRNFVLKPPPEVKMLDLTCALLRWYDVEFIAKPRVVHTNIMKSSL